MSFMQPGTVFAKDFRIVRHLSSGGMGSVFVVEQLSTGKERALKVMHMELSADAAHRVRFESEARISASIESDHVVEGLAAGVDPETNIPWLVMELLRGDTLEGHVEAHGPMSRGSLRECARQLKHVLEQAHTLGDDAAERGRPDLAGQDDAAARVGGLDVRAVAGAFAQRPGQSGRAGEVDAADGEVVDRDRTDQAERLGGDDLVALGGGGEEQHPAGVLGDRRERVGVSAGDRGLVGAVVVDDEVGDRRGVGEGLVGECVAEAGPQAGVGDRDYARRAAAAVQRGGGGGEATLEGAAVAGLELDFGDGAASTPCLPSFIPPRRQGAASFDLAIHGRRPQASVLSGCGALQRAVPCGHRPGARSQTDRPAAKRGGLSCGTRVG